MNHLGRGGHSIQFLNGRVIKTGVPHEEPLFMEAHPDVFVPVLQIYACNAAHTKYEYVMPAFEQPNPQLFLSEAMMSGLDKLRMLWERQPHKSLSHIADKTHWRRQLLNHVGGIISQHSVVVPDGIFQHVWRLPNPQRWVAIHGDPTYANIVRHPISQDWRWLDPLNRPYIPDDPHVDLGKLFQSCGGYESIITGEQKTVKNNTELMRHLARRAGLSLEVGLMWYVVHIVRLLPYQTTDVRRIYSKYLETVL